ncbi:MAG: hypothetical protein ACLFPW_11135 [Spirochaetaceae bacterium]
MEVTTRDEVGLLSASYNRFVEYQSGFHKEPEGKLGTDRSCEERSCRLSREDLGLLLSAVLALSSTRRCS